MSAGASVPVSPSRLIRSRRSVRTFAPDKPLDSGTLDQILAYANSDAAENPLDLSIRWKILPAGDEGKRLGLTSPVIVGEQAWIAGKLPVTPHAAEAFGYSFERVLLFAWSFGIGSTWIAGTMDRPAFERAMKLESDAGWVMPCVSPLGYPAARMSFRETMMRKGIRADTRMEFGELFFDGSFDAPLTPEKAGPLAPVLELIRPAPSAVNKQPWRVVLDSPADENASLLHFYEKRGKGYVSPDGWDIQRIDMGIALCHCILGLGEAGLSGSVALADPGLAVPEPENTVYCFTVKVGQK